MHVHVLLGFIHTVSIISHHTCSWFISVPVFL